MPLYSKVANFLRSATSIIDVFSSTAPSSGQVLTATGSSAATWQTPSGSFPFQTLLINGGDSNTIQANQLLITTNTTGTTMYIAFVSSGSTTTAVIQRYVKDSLSVNYYMTHETTLTITAGGLLGLAVAGSFLYVSCTIAAANALRQYAIADLSGVASMTFSGTSRAGCAFSDGTDLYIRSGSGTADKFTISGTTATNAATNTYTGSFSADRGVICNGTSVWATDNTNTSLADGGTFTINKFPLAGAGAPTATLTMKGNIDAYTSTSNVPKFFMASSTTLGIGYGYSIVTALANNGLAVNVFAITLP